MADVYICLQYLVGGLEHGFYFSIYWECHHPNWWTHIFQRGRSTTNQLITWTWTHFSAGPAVNAARRWLAVQPRPERRGADAAGAAEPWADEVQGLRARVVLGWSMVCKVVMYNTGILWVSYRIDIMGFDGILCDLIGSFMCCFLFFRYLNAIELGIYVTTKFGTQARNAGCPHK